MGSVSYDKDVYVSYYPSNREWVVTFLVPQLEAAGLKVVLGDRDFQVGVPRIKAIEHAIDSTRHTLLVISPDWLNSEWGEFENLLVSAIDPIGRQRRMIPLILEPCVLPPRIGMFTAADFTGTEAQDEKEAHRLIRSLKARASVFVALREDAEVDVSLAKRIAGGLEREGHQVFTVADIPVGMTYRLGVHRMIESCDYVVALLSERSVVDVRLIEQFEIAQEVSRAGDHGRLLPVRVGYTDPLPAAINPIFEDLGYVLWRDFDDDEAIVRKLREAIALLTDLEPVRKAEELTVTTASTQSKLWANGAALRICFLDGEPDMCWQIAKIASEWTRYANLRFVFCDDSDAEVRISFKLPGSWSYMATDALAIAKNQPTVNFGWFTASTPQIEVQRVVLHEFGHVLGFVHEHQISEAKIPWNKPAVYAAYEGPPHHWTRLQIDAQMFQTYPEGYFPVAKEFDPLSIMAFPIPRDYTDGEFEIGWNVELSEIDKHFAALLYPSSIA